MSFPPRFDGGADTRPGPQSENRCCCAIRAIVRGQDSRRHVGEVTERPDQLVALELFDASLSSCIMSSPWAPLERRARKLRRVCFCYWSAPSAGRVGWLVVSGYQYVLAMSDVVAESRVEVRSELLHLRFEQSSSVSLGLLRHSLVDLEDFLDVAGDLSVGRRSTSSMAALGGESTGFRIRSLRYGSPFEVEIELLLSAGPHLLAGTVTAVSFFTGLAAARLIWKRGDVKTAEANKLNAEANRLNAETEGVRRQNRTSL